MNKKLILALAIAVVLGLSIVAVGYFPGRGTETSDRDQSQGPFTTVSLSAPSSPISVELTAAAFTEKPKLASETDLILTAAVHPTYSLSLPPTTAQIELPEGITLVSGDIEWAGDLTIESPLTLQARVRFAQVGDWAVTARVKSDFGGGDWYGGIVHICFSVSEETLSMQQGECPTGPISPPGTQEAKADPAKPPVGGWSEVGPITFDTATVNATILSFQVEPYGVGEYATYPLQVRVHEIIKYERYEDATYPALKVGDVVEISIEGIDDSTKSIFTPCPDPGTSNSSQDDTGTPVVLCESSTTRSLTAEEGRDYLTSLIDQAIVFEGITNCGNECEKQIWLGSIRIETVVVE